MATLDFSLERTSDPSVEPLSLSEVRNHVGIVGDHDNDRLSDLIQAAREQFEIDTGLALINQTWVQRLDRPPWFGTNHNFIDLLDDQLFHTRSSGIGRNVRLLRRPVSSLTSVTYLDLNGDSQTWSSSEYELDEKRVAPVVWLAYNQSWPSTRAIQNALTFTFVAGYGAAASDVPELIRQALLLQISAWYENRCMGPNEAASYEAVVERYAWAGYP